MDRAKREMRTMWPFNHSLTQACEAVEHACRPIGDKVNLPGLEGQAIGLLLGWMQKPGIV